MSKDGDDWKPNGRPTSTIARNFSASLNDAFSMDEALPELAGLAQSVEQKKQAVNSQSQELEALQARIRETEEQLKRKQLSNPSSTGSSGATSSPHRRQPLGDTFNGQETESPRGTAASQPNQGSTPDAISASTRSRWMPAPKD